MDWLLIVSAAIMVVSAAWLWYSAQPRFLGLKDLSAWVRRRRRSSGRRDRTPAQAWSTNVPETVAPTASAAPLTSPERPVSAPPRPTARVDVRPGPKAWLILGSGPRSGKRFSLRCGRNTVGRDPSAADIVLEDRAASGTHACIQLEDGEFYLYSLGDTGTFVNNREVGRTSLFDGDRMQIGQTVLVFERIDEAASGPRSSSGFLPPVSRRPYNYQIAVVGRLPVKMYDGDSCVLALRLLPIGRGSSIDRSGGKVIEFDSERPCPCVEVELLALGFETVGNSVQRHRWDDAHPRQCVWSIKPRSNGSFELGLVFRAQTSDLMEQVDVVTSSISVRNYAGLSKRQTQLVAGLLSTAGTVLGLAEVLHRLGWL